MVPHLTTCILINSIQCHPCSKTKKIWTLLSQVTELDMHGHISGTGLYKKGVSKKCSQSLFSSSLSVKIGLFYVVYYTFLTGFFIGMLVIFYQTLDDKQPKWQNKDGIIVAPNWIEGVKTWEIKFIVEIMDGIIVEYECYMTRTNR